MHSSYPDDYESGRAVSDILLVSVQPNLPTGVSMGSARTQCPECHGDGSNVVDLEELFFSPRVDFFRCRACLCWWMVPKGKDGPATRVIMGGGKANSAIDSKKVG